MKKTALVVAAALLGLSAPAGAQVRPRGGYIQVPVKHQSTALGGIIIYMNRDGGTYHGTYNGSFNEDSAVNDSSIFQGTATLAPYPYGDASWQQVMDCMREIYAPFDVEITDVDPGSTPHVECVTAGDPGDIGMDSSTGGVAPFSCGVIPQAVVYTFPDVWGNSPRDICETAAQETAHAFGLDHEHYCPDPMTYLFGCGNKAFANLDEPCGEYSDRACQCGGSTQNSFAMLTAALGSGGPQTPPSVTITYPSNGDHVEQGFEIDVDASDSIGVSVVQLFIDGNIVDAATSAPYVFHATQSLEPGTHTIDARATNLGGLATDDMIDVDVDPPCTTNDQCPSDAVCIGGMCQPGPGTGGGLGDPCTVNEDCSSAECASDGTNGYCTVGCDLSVGEGACPQGFDCLDGGGIGLCWPNGMSTHSSGGCAVAPSPAPLAGWAAGVLLALLAVALPVIRRRRRPPVN